jgi:hypothetical protein
MGVGLEASGGAEASGVGAPGGDDRRDGEGDASEFAEEVVVAAPVVLDDIGGEATVEEEGCCPVASEAAAGEG